MDMMCSHCGLAKGHAALRRKNLPEELVDSTLPNAEGMTGPWQQTMAAAAAVELANDGWMTIFSTEEGVAPVERF